LDENSGGTSDENASKLKKDLLLVFEEQEKSLAIAPRVPRPHHHPTKPSHPPTDQEHDQSGTGYGRLEELGHFSPLRNQDQVEEPQEQQDVDIEAMGEDDYDYDREGRHQDEAKGINSGIHQSESGNHSNGTNNEDDKDDEDPRPTKQQKLSLVYTIKAITPPHEHSPTPRLTPSLTI